jgi:hypothetical protein
VAAAKNYQFSFTGWGDTRLLIDGLPVAQMTTTGSGAQSV